MAHRLLMSLDMAVADPAALETREICADDVDTRDLFVPDLSEAGVAKWVRWGWVPLIVGSVVIMTGILLGFQMALDYTGHVEHDPDLELLHLVRALISSLALAGWAGWFVKKAQGRLESAREALRQEQARLAKERWRAEQTAGLGALSRILAHEIRNPLNSMALHCAVLRRSAVRLPENEGARVREVADVLHGEITRLDQLVHDYLLYSKGPPPISAAEVDLAALVKRVLEVLGPSLADRDVSVAIREEPELPRAHADPARLEQVVHNVLRNAMEAQPAGGEISVGLRGAGARVELEVADHGPGFDDPAAVFRPFYTTKRGGSGLGLTIVRDVVRAHGGEVEASNLEVGHGARIVIRLPSEGAPS